MQPQQKYNRCIQVVLRKLFQIVSLDVFEDNYRRQISHYFVIGVYVGAIFGMIYSLLHFTKITELTSVALIFGAISVRIYVTAKK